MRLCDVEGCSKKHASNGYCGMHVTRMRRNGTLTRLLPNAPKLCTVNGCTRKHSARGYCHSHYSIAKYNGEFGEFIKCEVERCKSPKAYNDGLCKKHHRRVMRHGNTSAPPPPKGWLDEYEHLLSKVVR